MTRGAAVLLAAGLAMAACQTRLNFGAADASNSCATDKDCPLPSLHCDSFSGRCVGCATDADCTSTSGRPHCDSYLRFCVQCAGNEDCGTGGAMCNMATRTCVKTCNTAADCAASGGWCEDGICGQCDSDHDCGGSRPPHCDHTTDQCVGCEANTQCTSAAASVCNRAIGQCVGCVTSDDCGAGLVCDPSDWTCK